MKAENSGKHWQWMQPAAARLAQAQPIICGRQAVVLVLGATLALSSCLGTPGPNGQSRFMVEDWRRATPREPDADAWRPGTESPPATALPDGIRFPARFSTGQDRFYWDRDLALDLSNAHGVELAYRIEHPEAFRGVTLYARSGTGWYAAALPADRPGRHQIRVPLDRFSAEASPLGWNRIDRLRWSPWAAGRQDGALILESIAGYVTRVAVVLPTTSSPDSGERAFGRRIGEWFLSELETLGVAAARLDDEAVSQGALDGMGLAILPYNPEPTSQQLAALRTFVQGGGKLVVCYSKHPGMAELMGVSAGPYQAESRPGQWHAMAFEDTLPGAPARAVQTQTRNIIAAEPAGSQTRVVAWWEDDAGQRRPEAAWLLSPAGAWMTHVVLSEDAPGKRRMLLAIASALLPEIRDEAVRRLIARARSITAEDGLDASLARIEQRSREHGRNLSRRWQEPMRQQHAAIEAALHAGNPFEALDLAAELQQMLSRRYAAVQPTPSIDEVRAVWDHHGTGLHAGNWAQTAPILQNAGFTDVLLYVPRNTVENPENPPSPLRDSLRAGRQSTLRIHPWKVLWNLDGIDADRLQQLEARNRLQISGSGAVTPWLCPSHPENRREEHADALKLAHVHGIAGLHLDYIRYPDAEHCYCNTCRRAFESAEGRPIADWPAAVRGVDPLSHRFSRWRADRITTFMRDLAREVKTIDDRLVLSIAVFPKADRVGRSIGQDWASWLQQGWIDWVLPMNYTEDSGTFARWVRTQQALPGVSGRLVPGIGVSASTSRLAPVDVVDQIGLTRRIGTRGFALFDLNDTLHRHVFPLTAILAETRDPFEPR